MSSHAYKTKHNILDSKILLICKKKIKHNNKNNKNIVDFSFIHFKKNNLHVLFSLFPCLNFAIWRYFEML